jgi:Flp pilus assembly protein TadG
MSRANQVRSSKRLLGVFHRFRNDQKGATAVEFALVSVPFLGLLFAIFETAFVFFATEGLEAATAVASRTIMTGGASSYTQADTFKTAVLCPALPTFIPCASVVLDANTVSSYGASSNYSNTAVSRTITTNTTTHNFCIGTQGDVVLLRVAYAMPVILSVLTASNIKNISTFGWGGLTHNLFSVAAFKNEPFGSTPTKNTGCS